MLHPFAPASGRPAPGTHEQHDRINVHLHEHADAVGRPQPIDADPFDRVLVAQAWPEPMRLLTHNATVAGCNDTIICV